MFAYMTSHYMFNMSLLIYLCSLEVDMHYIDNYLVVAQNHSIRFIYLNEADVTSTIQQF